MTLEQLNDIVSHFSRYQGRKVEFRHYIPSADRYATSIGFIHGIGRGNIVIASAGHTHMIYYTDVTLI